MIKLEDIKYSVETNGEIKQILKGVSLEVKKGEIVVITGPNGSGKSTLAKILMGILKQDSGKILFDKKDISNLSINDRAKLGLAFAFQQPVTFKGLKVRDLLDIACEKESKLSEKCDYLSVVGLCAKDYEKREVSNKLSGGELKRIEIATVLARSAKVNIFDEPEAGIDLWSFDRLVDIFKQRKSTTIIISHQRKILEIADRVVLLSGGKIEKVGKCTDIIPLLENKKCARLKGEGYEQ